jgi:hypothetical protein
MFDTIREAMQAYQTKWQDLIDNCKNPALLEGLRPTSVGWKVADLEELQGCFEQLLGQSDQVHYGWVNERWLVTLCLREPLPGDVKLVKLMQRRFGSKDALGLDHLDFYAPEITPKVLAKEPTLNWTEEKNGEHCKWLSLWFAGTEAKLRTDTVLEVCSREMLEKQSEILAGFAEPNTWR